MQENIFVKELLDSILHSWLAIGSPEQQNRQCLLCFEPLPQDKCEHCALDYYPPTPPYATCHHFHILEVLLDGYCNQELSKEEFKESMEGFLNLWEQSLDGIDEDFAQNLTLLTPIQRNLETISDYLFDFEDTFLELEKLVHQTTDIKDYKAVKEQLHDIFHIIIENAQKVLAFLEESHETTE